MDEAVTFGAGLNGILTGSREAEPVIITHGASLGMNSPLIKKTAHKLADYGFLVLRFNFAYLDKKSAPSFGGKKELPELIAAMDFMKAYGKPVLIGRSFGARVCANAAVGSSNVKALAFYGMPLQGASKAAKPRDWSHLAKINAPMLFISGDRDKLCPLDQLNDVLKNVSVPVKVEVVPGDHGFKPKSEDAAIEICTQWVNSLRL